MSSSEELREKLDSVGGVWAPSEEFNFTGSIPADAYISKDKVDKVLKSLEDKDSQEAYDKFCEKQNNIMLYGKDAWIPKEDDLEKELERVGYSSMIESSDKTKALAEMAKDIEEHPMKVIELKKNRRQKRAEAFAMKRAFKKEYKKMLSKFNNASKLEHKLEGNEIKEQQESIS